MNREIYSLAQKNAKYLRYAIIILNMIESKKTLTILGIETSCHETATAVINSDQ